MLQNIQLVAHEFPFLFGILFFIFGACAGSFMNVCIYRIPAGRSIVRPRSQCVCGRFIGWYDNIPILSWFLLRGKARCCGKIFSFRYAFNEIICGCLYLYLWINFDLTTGLVWMFFTSLLIVISYIDIDTMELPDSLTVGGFACGVVLSAIFPQIHDIKIDPSLPYFFYSIKGVILAILGAIVGSGILYWFRLLAECTLKREAMGEGDVVLMGCIGAFCGWQGAVFAIFGGSLIGALVMIPLMIFSKIFFKARARYVEIPFGPWLSIGAAAYVLFASNYAGSYLDGISLLFFGGI